ncbi:MAG: hypothetical protein EU529_05895 [Promethearchaeota archaeon]|nr:MAG: hypothetical protein EU529_05895 [Candidatus Lokiarchaeota archaeon]
MENKINETCIGCRWNNFPFCEGTIIKVGLEERKMRIDKLRPIFRCGQKNESVKKIVENRVLP